MRFRDFEDTAQELFGFDKGEAREFAAILDEAGLKPELYDADDAEYWELAADFTDEFFEDETDEVYPLDPFFPDDDYLYAGDEMELTAESEEGYGDD
jgi:hypothetical protein